ncbi:MAG TPA: iron ABC transporter permease [Planctomycetota bacterium]
MNARRRWVLAAMAAAGVVALALAPLVGAAPLGSTVVREIRLPRVLLAFLAGAGLSLAGMTFQALFRNPLASPFTLGVSSGAALGAALAIRLGLTFSVLGISGISLSAFGGALGALLLVYGIGTARRGLGPAVMLLAGVAASYFFSSVLLLVQNLSGFSDSLRIVRWLMGGLETVGYGPVIDLLPFAVFGVAVVFLHARELNLLSLGDELAVSRGVRVARVRAVLFVAATLMVGGVVAVCGPIGFVGMVAPHIARLLIGSEHRHLTPASFLMGGIFLVVCDAIGRTVIAPAEIPVGVVTALPGGPFFVWLLLRRSSPGHLMS